MPSRPSIPAEITREILIESGHRCAVCGTPCPLERAHIIPWHKSKEHKAEDLICLCANCHQRADHEGWGERTLREYKRRPWVMRQRENTDSRPETTTRLEVTIEMEAEDSSEKNQRLLQYGIAAFLEIPPSAVQIASTGRGNVNTIELKTQSAERLLSAYGRDEPELARHLAPLKLPQDVSIKYSAFTLCYSMLLAHLNDLNHALRGDTRGLTDRIIAQFDGALKQVVYQSKPRDLNHAVEILVLPLQSLRVAVDTLNPDVAKIIEETIADIEQRASNWQCETEVERYREWGEKLSRLFYEGTPWLKTQERLTTNTHLVFRYAGLLDTVAQGQNTYGYRVAPMAFYPEYNYASTDEPEENVILIRFSFEHDFSTFLMYPFLFFHEYASHVHGPNSDIDIFDDGWMLYAIYSFLVSESDSLPSAYCLHADQIRSISEHCPSKISTVLKRYYFLAGTLH